MFTNGHKPWNKGKKYPAPWLEEHRFGNRPKAKHDRSKYTAEERKEIWGHRKGKSITKAHLQKMMEGQKKKGYRSGYKLSKEHKEKIRLANKNRSPEIIKKTLRRRKVSSLEAKFKEIVEKNKLPYKWVGNGEVIIGRKNPDFVNTNGQKVAIEVYYRRHKEEFRDGLKEWKLNREKIFNEYGWKLLFFDETEVNESKVMEVIG